MINDLKLLRKYFFILKPYLCILFVLGVIGLSVVFLGLLIPLFARVIFDYVYTFRDIDLLNETMIVAVVACFAFVLLKFIFEHLKTYIKQEINLYITEKIFGVMQYLPPKVYIENKCDSLLNCVTSDAAKMAGMLVDFLPTVIIDGFRILIIFVISFFVSSRLALIALVSIPLYFFETHFYSRRIANTEKAEIKADADVFARSKERLAGIREIKAFSQERGESLSFSQLLKRRYGIAVRGRFLRTVKAFSNSISLQIWCVFLVWYLSRQVISGSLSAGEIVVLILYVWQLESPVKSFIDLFAGWNANLASMRRIDEVFSMPVEKEEDVHAKRLLIKEGNLLVSHLSFENSINERILSDINVSFKPCSVSAIVGDPGSGKTTFINLLARFLTPSSGVISIDGQNISEVSLYDLRDKIGIINKEAVLFDGTVMDNILYGSEGLERGDAMRAARLARAHNFIEKLPGGYDASVGAMGELLSAGQKQMLCIARVLLRNPPIVIFDEAPRHLDAESEYLIHEAISDLRTTKTVLIIARCLSTIKSADNILVLENGDFVESGRFEELLEKRGAFYNYYWRSFGGLAEFKKRMDHELERALRYGSKFCFAMLRLEKTLPVTNRFIDAVNSVLKKNMRLGDDLASLDQTLILMLLPEIDVRQLKQFFDRMLKLLSESLKKEFSCEVGAEDLFFAGTRITKKHFKTSDDLILALKNFVTAKSNGDNFVIIDEKEIE